MTFLFTSKTNCIMEQSKNMEQAGAASTVPTEKKNESRKREVSGKDVQAIRTF